MNIHDPASPTPFEEHRRADRQEFSKGPRRNVIWYGACGGLIVGLVFILLLDPIASLPRNAFVSTMFRELHRPESWLADVLAGGWERREIEPVLWVGLLLLKWLAIGASAAWLYAFTARRSRNRME